ncbi:uroporphyrinogen-III C-methyltransferase [Castellaniella sp.]|uniref:uroporphyrinogen-III C-methyltransferase n=1 Tax=Castellaniella sp. TaxID=1955812 RepID=UPI003C722EFB
MLPDSVVDSTRRTSGDVPGHVWLVGAGPGDPELITLKGMRALQQADVVIYDRLAPLALLDHCRPDAIRVSVGKQAGWHSVPQEGIHGLLVRYAWEGRNVVRLKGGDPFVFGRGGEEMIALRRRGIPVSVIPGVTAASGCAAATGIPLTHRGVAAGVCLSTAHRQEGAADLDWTALAADRHRTLVFYMGLSQAGRVADELVRRGLPAGTPVALIACGTMARQRAVRCRLDNLMAAAHSDGLVSPCLIVVGQVVMLADPASVPWMESRQDIAAACPA